MSNLEYYFENLLFNGADVNGDLLTKEEQEAVEACYEYILYTLFYGDRDKLKEWLENE